MATLQESVVAIPFTMADPAAAPGGAFLAPAGAPDIADFAALPLPYPGAIVGISIVGAPASGDTVTATPQICSNTAGGGAAAVAALATQITNAAPSGSTIVAKDSPGADFAAGAFLGVKYTTTTGGAYTAKDVVVIVYVQTGLEDI